jgi:hypothetical protein
VLTFNAVSVPPLPATLRARLTHRQQIREFQGENLRVGSRKSVQMLKFEENGSISCEWTCLEAEAHDD